MIKRLCLLTILISLVFGHNGYGQNKRIYLDSLLKTAIRNYPLIKAKHLQSEALQEAIKAKRNTVIPSLAASYQADYATYNNITGMVYPEYIIPITGPPSQANNYSGTPGTAAALNLSWDPVTFGRRHADIELAKGNLQYGQADENLTIFQQQINVINAWLNYSLLDDLAKVYKQNINRTVFNLKQSQSLVSSGMRPGTDSASFSAELASARIQLIAYERQRDSSLQSLTALTGGVLPSGFASDTSLFSSTPGAGAMPDTSITEHPEVKLQQASVTANELLLNSIKKDIMPKLTIWSAGYGRGSGVAANGSVNANDGWQFERYNYGIGAQLSFPILEIFRQKPLWRQQRLNTDASREQLEQTKLDIQTQARIADNNYKKALEAAKIAPQQFTSANFSYQAILSRYQSGLVNYYDVIQAQQSLFQSQANVAVAYYNAWKSLLNKAAYAGNINLFLTAYHQ
ncbi:MAG: TolC family protein [Bacteroidetes bacterium]|nr:TolC family protein [Bacteroidota bacterium]